jgi:hypothetical protein
MIKAWITCLILCACNFSKEQPDGIAFSHSGGFYEESFNLALSCADTLHIRYTLNGSTPTSHSALYAEPLFLDETLYSKSDIYKIVNTIPSRFYCPSFVDKAIVVRAATFDENENPVGEVITNTYLIKALGCDLHGLPMLSIVTDSLELFDYETGIFVPGVNYDVQDSTTKGNYCMTGREWERAINIEFYEPDNSGINHICGLRTHGGASRWYQQKGMKLYARREYSQKRFQHDFFGQHLENGYKRLVLHPFQCSNWHQTGGQDFMAQRVASHQDLNIDCLGVRQTVVFINGEYWGIYTLEESPDEHYVADHYLINKERVNLIKWWRHEKNGDWKDWSDFMRWAQKADMSKAEDQDYAFSRMDMPNFLDYLIFETFSANLDWPHNNVMQWQSDTGEPFRFIFYDGDGCFTKLRFKALKNAVSKKYDSDIIAFFLGSEEFRRMFISRSQELKKSVFSYETTKPVLDEYRSLVQDEIWRQSSRFNFPVSETRWMRDMDAVDKFFRERNMEFEMEMFDFMRKCQDSLFNGVKSLNTE